MLLAFRNYPLFLNSLASLSIKKLVFKFKHQLFILHSVIFYLHFLQLLLQLIFYFLKLTYCTPCNNNLLFLSHLRHLASLYNTDNNI